MQAGATRAHTRQWCAVLGEALPQPAAASGSMGNGQARVRQCRHSIGLTLLQVEKNKTSLRANGDSTSVLCGDSLSVCSRQGQLQSLQHQTLAEEALPASAAAAWSKLCWHSNWPRQLRAVACYEASPSDSGDV